MNISRGILRIFIAVMIVVAFVFFIAGLLRLWEYIQQQKGPSSAQEYYLAEREFVDTYVHDKKNGGYAYWVEQDGSIKDSKKYSIFQANIILWVGGIESQYHDEKNIEMIEFAADYLVKYLYKGKGEWYDYDMYTHRTKRDFFWNPRSEGYIAHALFQAYRYTQNSKYLMIAQETTAALRKKNPTGLIYAEYDPSQDIGFRFPEHMAMVDEFRLTGNQEALDYVRLYDSVYAGRYAKEFVTPDGEIYYYHGTGIIDQLLYGYLDYNTKAYDEASEARSYYWSMMYDEAKPFNENAPGESSDNGRDYYDKRVAMDQIEWTNRYEELYREDAVDTWFELKRFWDLREPHGFFVNTSETRKTCFTIGMPMMMMDLLPPQVVSWEDTNKALWNHQAKVVLRDTERYRWNDIILRGIGLNSLTFKYKAPFGFYYGKPEIVPGPCEGCATYYFNFVSFFSGNGKVSAEDYFSNKEWLPVPSTAKLAIREWSNLNNNSIWYYFILFTVALITVIITSIVLLFIWVVRDDYIPEKTETQKTVKRKIKRKIQRED